MLPQGQVQGIPGAYSSDTCPFEIFFANFKETRNIKKEIQSMRDNPNRKPISNIKLPELSNLTESKFILGKGLPQFDVSPSLDFKTHGRKAAQRDARLGKDTEGYQVLDNIKKFMEAKNKKSE